MYPLIKEYILKGLSKHIASGIVAYQSSMEIGSPCIIDLGNIRESDTAAAIHNKTPIKDVVNSIFESGDDISTKINILFKDYNSTTIPVIYLFPLKGSMVLYERNYAFSYHCVKTTPILTDKFKSVHLDSDKQVGTVFGDVNTFIKNLITDLDNNRYVNYYTNEICKSKIGLVSKFAHGVVNSILKTYPKNMCSYLGGNGNHTLLDVMSISFYKLMDVIPIFDKRSADGIVVELLFTNSTLSADEIFKRDGNYMLTRFLFSKYADNLFTIDGEKIKRSFQCDIGTAMEQILSNSLKRNTPDDSAFKKVESNRGGK